VTAATLTGLLGDEDRLRVVAAIALGARTIDDVATGGLLRARSGVPFRA
jgi:hypothetical protein